MIDEVILDTKSNNPLKNVFEYVQKCCV